LVLVIDGRIPKSSVFILSLRAIKIQRREIWTKMGGVGWVLSRKLKNIEMQTQRKYFGPGG
jgi:hypothetical protein